MSDLGINPCKTFDTMHEILNGYYTKGKLVLQDFGFKDMSVRVLCRILEKKTNLYSLDLTCNKVGITNIDCIMNLLIKNESICELILNSNNITSACLDLLIDTLIETNHVMSLSLKNSVTKQKNVFNLKDVKNLDLLMTHGKCLKILNLSNVKIGDTGVSCLSRHFQKSFISKLVISSCSITDKSANNICKMLM